MITSIRPAPGSDVGHYYDELGPLYREAWGERLHHGLWLTSGESCGEALDNHQQMVLTRAAVRPGETVIDIGCGYGALTRRLAGEFGAVALGVTNSREQFKIASATAAGGARFQFGDWLENGLPDNSADVAISVECLSHVADKPRFLRETARVLRPGGRLIVVDWTAPDRPPVWLETAILRRICGIGRLAAIGSAGVIGAMLSESGFGRIEAVDLSREARRTWPAMGFRLAKLALTRSMFVHEWLFRPLRAADFAAVVSGLMAAFYAGSIGYGIFEASRQKSK